MGGRVLITGGAGFIGSHLADDLLSQGYRVRVLDSFIPQVHGDERVVPDYLAEDVEVVRGDVRDPDKMREALAGVDEVFHLAAMVGVGQSMYQVDEYTAVNDLGTATLLQALLERPVRRLIVASSMSIYGEGLYRNSLGETVDPGVRTLEQLKSGRWDMVDADGGPLVPVPTPEDKRTHLASVYALSKFVQERMCLMVAQAYGIEAAAMRFFNVYGTRQALSNPYTGVLAIFAARLLNGRRPMVFEDGEQRRDFIHVHDVARVCRQALQAPDVAGRVFNIGSGNIYTITELGQRLANSMGRPDLEPEVTGRYRLGDIRHCFADIGLARRILGFQPSVALETGLAELVDWLSAQIAVDRVEAATYELASRGLVA